MPETFYQIMARCNTTKSLQQYVAFDASAYRIDCHSKGNLTAYIFDVVLFNGLYDLQFMINIVKKALKCRIRVIYDFFVRENISGMGYIGKKSLWEV